MSKPSWDDAPEWANWLAMDSDGVFIFHENRPVFLIKDLFWFSTGKMTYCVGYGVIADMYACKNSLEQRP